MSRRMVCPSGHRWELDPDDDPAADSACLFCGAPARPEDVTADMPADRSRAATLDMPAGRSQSSTLSAAGPPADPDRPETLVMPPGSTPLVPGLNAPDVPGYRVRHRLGRGGMGEVWLATQAGTGRQVALKVPRAGAGLDELARFRAEAEALARLQHPGIVPVYEVGEANGRLYLALELCPGGSLADRLDGTPLPPRTAAALTESLALAVHAAHRAGVVHRDLKPGNVLLAPRPDHPPPAAGADITAWVPKVTDFGLARWLDEERGLTHTGAILGTPAYMAPEQAFGGANKVGPAADVYALGVILYELLTGRPPFRGATALDTLDQLRTHDPVPPARLLPSLPRDLDTICLKCLHKDPARRYATAAELADDARRFLDGRPVLARPVGPGERAVKWVRRNPRVAVLAGLLAAAVLAGAVGAGVYQYRLAAQQVQLVAQRDRAVRHLQVALRSVDGLLTEVAEDDLAAEPLAEGKRRALLEKALRFCQELLQVEGDDPLLREHAALAAKRVGDIQRELGRYPEARAAYARALAQLEPLAAADPGRSDLARHVADCHNFTGEVDRLTARPREAADGYRAALGLQQRVADAEPENAAVRHELARSRYNLGLVLRDTGQLPEARAEFEAAAELLRAVSPDTVNRRWHLGRALLNLGAVLRLQNDPAARVAYAESVPLFEELAERNPKRKEFRHELAKALINRANLHAREPDAAVTTDSFLRARELLAKLGDDFPQTPEFRGDLATACNGLAAVAFAKKDLPAAEKWLGESAAAWRAVIATHPAVPDYHAGLGLALGNIGRVRLVRQDARQATAAAAGFAALAAVPSEDPAPPLEEGVRELAAALRANPDQPDLRASLRQQCSDVAKLAARTDPALATRTADALAAAVPAGSVGPAYAAFLLARFVGTAGPDSDTGRAAANRALAMIHGMPAGDRAAHEKLLADPAFAGVRKP